MNKIIGIFGKGGFAREVKYHLIKKHKMRNIVVFADVNNIKLMVENIESDKDYEFLSKLDLYTVDK